MKNGELRVWWIPQVPMKPFYVTVDDLQQAKLITDTLTKYDDFQFRNNIKPDYANAGGLEIFEDGEWSNWYSDEGMDFNEYCEGM